jgi:hypothetical protein
MSKGHRGKGIKSLVKHGRSACPVCMRSAVKVLYEVTIKEKTVKVCKTCKAALAHGKFQKEADAIVPASAPAPAPEPAPATT